MKNQIFTLWNVTKIFNHFFDVYPIGKLIGKHLDVTAMTVVEFTKGAKASFLYLIFVIFYQCFTKYCWFRTDLTRTVSVEGEHSDHKTTIVVELVGSVVDFKIESPIIY